MTRDYNHREALAAISLLQRLGYTWRGGEEWVPPLGQPPAFGDDRYRLFVSSAILRRDRGQEVTLQGSSFVTLARNSAEALGLHVATMQAAWPGFYVFDNKIATDPAPDEMVREAARQMGMR